ncbi:MAG: PH domain-containing protein [Bacilli bacterium]|nr:PH domain-containing protein [Bacilli bacterium]
MARIDSDFFKIDDNAAIKVNAVEDVLTEDEEVLLRLTPDRRDYILESIFKGLPFVLLWVAFDVFAITMMVNSGAFAHMGAIIFLIIGFFALHLLPVWLYVAGIVRRIGGYKNVEYVFTDRRLIIRSGLVGIDFKFFYYSDITSVDVKVGLWDRMFKVGDIYVKSTTQAAVLEDVHNPYQYGAKIQELIQDIKTDISYPNALRPDENPGYGTKYNKK